MSIVRLSANRINAFMMEASINRKQRPLAGSDFLGGGKMSQDLNQELPKSVKDLKYVFLKDELHFTSFVNWVQVPWT